MTDKLCVDTIRCLSADVVQGANSGHPGMPMGMAPIAHVLWNKVMKYAPKHSKWPDRDRFVLSNGHGCALLYSMLHLTGYDLPMAELKRFRQLNSKTPGHPELGWTDGVEVTTGPLGQGIANAVGMAIAEANLAANFNKPGYKLMDHFTYVFCGDGCLQEGVSGEASSLAGHLNLSKLIVLYDDNSITIDGPTSLSFSEDVLMRYRAYGWHTSTVMNGDTNLDGILQAIEEAKLVNRPSMIAVKTIIGYGSRKANTHGVHGAPLGDKELTYVKKHFNLPNKKFEVAQKVYDVYNENCEAGNQAVSEWNALFAKYCTEFPTEGAELTRRLAGDLPQGWQKVLPRFTPKQKGDATRNLSGKVLNALAAHCPELMGGSADLTPSNKTAIKGSTDFQKETPHGRYLRFGVREHGMAAIGNGLAAHGGFIPFTATFLNFIQYCFPSVRLAALSHIQQLFIMTHDSIGLGEDGPTHQPIEAIAQCRSCPGVYTFRPCDGNETSGSYMAAMLYKKGPSVFALTRQGLPQQPGSSIENTLKGAYVISGGNGKPDLTFVASGSEVPLAIEAGKILAKSGTKVRVVSMPCMKLFDQQSVSYRRSVITPGVPTISCETAAVFGWNKYSHYCIGMRSFGHSAPIKDVMKLFGFTPAQVVDTTTRFISKVQKESNNMGFSKAFGPLGTHFDVILPSSL